MGRTWSNMGFTPAAREILRGDRVKKGLRVVTELDLNHHPVKTYTQDITGPDYTQELLSSQDMWYGEMLELYIYRFINGRVLESYVQADPWSSGPVTFLALRDHETKVPVEETLWSQEEIDEA